LRLRKYETWIENKKKFGKEKRGKSNKKSSIKEERVKKIKKMEKYRHYI